MECFTLFRKHLAMSGINLKQSPKNSIVLVSVSLYLIAIVKLLDEAKTFDEYTNIIYRLFFVYLLFLFYLIVTWKTPQLYRFVNSLEYRINKSKKRPK